MPTFMMIPVDKLVEPLNPQRQETLLKDIDFLRESIRTKGLEQPIGVRDIGDGSYRIIWGHRRSIAVTQLQWSHVAAMVHTLEESDDDSLMAAENYHRNSTSDAEEALFYKRIFDKFPDGTIGIARELNVPQTRIERLLICADGDEKVFEAMRAQTITLAQAYEINQYKSPGYRAHALDRCLNGGMSALALKQWRKDLEAEGMIQTNGEQSATWTQKLTVTDSTPQANCQLGNHMVPLNFRRVWEICNEHWNIILEGLELWGQKELLQKAGLWNQYRRLLSIAEGSANVGAVRQSNGTDTTGS